MRHASIDKTQDTRLKIEILPVHCQLNTFFLRGATLRGPSLVLPLIIQILKYLRSAKSIMLIGTFFKWDLLWNHASDPGLWVISGAFWFPKAVSKSCKRGGSCCNHTKIMKLCKIIWLYVKKGTVGELTKLEHMRGGPWLFSRWRCNVICWGRFKNMSV